MSVEMALAECQHHSAQRQKKARAGEEEREVRYMAAFRTTVPPIEPDLFDLFAEPDGEAARLVIGAAGGKGGGPVVHRGAHRRYLAVRADS